MFLQASHAPAIIFHCHDQQALPVQVQRQAQSITPEQRAAMTQQAGISHPDAQRLRAEGNQLHKAGSYKAASDKYEAALREISGVPAA